MKIHRYNTTTGDRKALPASFEIRRAPEAPYVFLTQLDPERPDPLPGHRVQRASDPVIDLEAGTIVWPWEQIELPPVDPDSLVPDAITPRQMRLALLARGISPAMIAGMLAGNEAAMIEWEYSLEILRTHPLVTSMASAMGMEDSDVKALFTAAAEL
jgi:hypothetical protein